MTALDKIYLQFGQIICFYFVKYIWQFVFLDAIASPSTYSCQWVSGSLIVSDLEIAIASPSLNTFAAPAVGLLAQINSTPQGFIHNKTENPSEDVPNRNKNYYAMWT